jgi:hypothetical protein
MLKKRRIFFILGRFQSTQLVAAILVNLCQGKKEKENRKSIPPNTQFV